MSQVSSFHNKPFYLKHFCHIFYSITKLSKVCTENFLYKKFIRHISASTMKIWLLTENSLSSCRCFTDSLSLFCLCPSKVLYIFQRFWATNLINCRLTETNTKKNLFNFLNPIFLSISFMSEKIYDRVQYLFSFILFSN